ncbi:MAG: hemolysin III family protein [Myxococcales bacterium]|nr:hemolysin III family protein [Myxococcales bacterium]MCB9530621.1 hemolysin III family protein [Myxococcales bacterium]
MLRRTARATVAHCARLGVEEVLNTLTHGLGFAVAALAGIVLIAATWDDADGWQRTGVAVYVGSLVFLLAASTVYHSVIGERLKAAMRRVDHLGIKLLIAGSYTPFVLVHARSRPGFALLGTVWGLLLVGVAAQIWAGRERYFRIALVLYLAMGLALVPFFPALHAAFPPGAMGWLVAGGALYLIGVIFFVWESLPYSHAIWHLFVLAASTAHFAAVALYAA